MSTENVQSPLISHADPMLHTVRDTNGLPLPHPAEQPREVIEAALNQSREMADTTYPTQPKDVSKLQPVHEVENPPVHETPELHEKNAE